MLLNTCAKPFTLLVPYFYHGSRKLSSLLGEMTNVQDLPIDIHSGKLLDWLISRRHCQKDWQKNVLVIREKIKHAILDMPESDEVVKLLQGSCDLPFADINYFHCQRIIEILRETEKDTKNFLGFYSSQRMKDWQAKYSPRAFPVEP
ncbi:unnamed protein product [Strongylus vulgaris]|uniref:Uncharacterized protein n=1 Tax=Strongylus vulgaris TaxID=40348 RepID=A0A3P7L8X6_STRVU|nr:unnamed protein product [Strongylus vulgaris]